MGILAIRAALQSANKGNSKALFDKQSKIFEKDLLLQDRIPQDYFDLMIDLLSDESLSNLPGADDFIMKFYYDKEKQTEQQKKLLLSAIVENYGKYREEEFCLVICDFVARAYPPNSALEALSEMAGTSHEVGLGAILVGTEVILKSKVVNPGSSERARKLYRRVQTKIARN